MENPVIEVIFFLDLFALMGFWVFIFDNISIPEVNVDCILFGNLYFSGSFSLL